MSEVSGNARCKIEIVKRVTIPGDGSVNMRILFIGKRCNKQSNHRQFSHENW